jgi:hypothetical protein
VADPRPLLLFQQGSHGLLPLNQQQHAASVINNRFPLTSIGTISAERMAHIIQHDVRQLEIQEMMREQNISSTAVHSDAVALEYIQNRLNYDEFQETAKDVRASLHFDVELQDAEGTASMDDDAEDAVHALSALSLSDFPKITEEQEEVERATMTSEDRAAALSDLFGQYCSIEPPWNKRPKRDLDPRSIDFLIRQMKLELDLIPVGKKQALLEAQTKCRQEEFGDARLEKFLRTQGMNTKVCIAVSVRMCVHKHSVSHF